MNWLATVLRHVDYLSGRYEAFPMRDETTRAATQRMLGHWTNKREPPILPRRR